VFILRNLCRITFPPAIQGTRSTSKMCSRKCCLRLLLKLGPCAQNRCSISMPDITTASQYQFLKSGSSLLCCLSVDPTQYALNHCTSPHPSSDSRIAVNLKIYTFTELRGDYGLCLLLQLDQWSHDKYDIRYQCPISPSQTGVVVEYPTPGVFPNRFILYLCTSSDSFSDSRK